MKLMCAWCGKELTGPAAQEIADVPISHGICGDCVRSMMAYLAKPMRDFLEQFQSPVLLVDGDARVVTANSAALALLQKGEEEVEGQLGGDAFGCTYADLPGGCGKTVHCKTCTIRNSIVATLHSGTSCIRVPAYPDLHYITGEAQVRFLITTEKVGEAVLLRVDEVAEEKALPQE